MRATAETDGPFSVTVISETDRLVIKPVNALDSPAVAIFHDHLAPHLPTERHLTVDLEDATVVTSAGIDGILDLQRHCPSMDIDCSHAWQVQLLEMAGLSHLSRAPGR